jgi:transposase
MPRLDPATHNNTTDRLQTGQSQTEVARQFNVHQSTISRLWQRLNQTGSAQDRPRSRRPRITTPAQDRYIRVFHLRNRTVTATATAAGIPSLRRIYTQTVRNRLRQRKIRPRRPYVGSVLTQVHSCACVIHLGSGLWGTSAEFDSAMRVPFSSHDGRAREYSRRNYCFFPACVQEVDRFGGGGVMIWVQQYPTTTEQTQCVSKEINGSTL